MLWVKRTTYDPAPSKNEEFAILRTEIKHAIKKLIEDNQKLSKNRHGYIRIAQQIRKEYQEVSAEKDHLKKLLDQYENGRQKAKYWQSTKMSTFPIRAYLQKDNRHKRHVHYVSNDDELYDEDLNYQKKWAKNVIKQER